MENVKNTITLPALDWWAAVEMINTLSGIEGADEAITALEDYRDSTAAEFAVKYANEGDPEKAAEIMALYDGDLASDPNDPCYDQSSPWNEVARAIRQANRRNAARDAVAIWFEDERREDELLRQEAENVKAEPHNLFKAGTFEGMARITAATIHDNGADRGASETQLTVAIYNRYGVAW